MNIKPTRPRTGTLLVSRNAAKRTSYHNFQVGIPHHPRTPTTCPYTVPPPLIAPFRVFPITRTTNSPFPFLKKVHVFTDRCMKKKQHNSYVRIPHPRLNPTSCPSPVPRPLIRHSLLPAPVFFRTTGTAYPPAPRPEQCPFRILLQREPSIISRWEYPTLAGPLQASFVQYSHRSLLHYVSSRTPGEPTHPLPILKNAEFGGFFQGEICIKSRLVYSALARPPTR